MSTTRNRTICHHLILLTVLTQVLLACSTGEIDRGVAETTVEGVIVRTYYEPEPPAIDPFAIEEGQVYGLGQGPDTYLLTGASPHAVLDDGTVYVLDARETSAHRFAADGTYLGSFGKQGQGPGEFYVLQDLVHLEDRLYTNDPFNMRLTVMDLEGRMIRSVQFPESTPRSRFMIPYRFTDGIGSILIDKEVRYPFVEGQEPEALFRVLRLDDRLAIHATLHEQKDTFDVIRINERPRAQPYAALTPATGMAPGMPVAWSYGREFRIDFLDPEDLSRWAVVIPHEPIPVSEGMRAAEVTMYERLTRSEGAANRMNFPDHLPFINSIDDMLWDTGGRLWVLEYRDHTVPDTPYRYQVFSKEGKWLLRQDLAVRPWLITADGFFVRTRDDEGNPVIRFYYFKD